MSTLKVGAIQSTTGNAAMTVANTGVITAPNAIVAPGSVLQVQYTQYTSTFSQSITANTDTVLGSAVLTLNITPKSTSSIIRLDAHVMHEWGRGDAPAESMWFFYRDTTKLAAPSSGSRSTGITPSMISYYNIDATSTPESVYYTYFDSPSSTSQITYKIGVRNALGTNLHVNKTVNDHDTSTHERGISFISATEIGG